MQFIGYIVTRPLYSCMFVLCFMQAAKAAANNES